MNGFQRVDCPDGKNLDLLSHRYRPNSSSKFSCHIDEAQRLKKWIQDFVDSPYGMQRSDSHSDYEDSSNSANSLITQIPKCALLTGPPGVGKTSLVYTIANELKLHVVESHASEKRDSRLFSSLKLTNQKGKINAIAKLFQAAQQKQQQSSLRKKRRKLSETQTLPQPQSLSLSGDTSIILFDDIDVVFDEDGPFLKSLVEFIKESKRPVVLTATQSTDRIKEALIHFEHINLSRPIVSDCSNLLADVCKREKVRELSNPTRCETIANYYECDIRQCLNRIHFYGDKADQLSPFDNDCTPPDFSKLKLEAPDDAENGNKSLLNCYSSFSLIDVMDSKLNLVNRNTLLQRWLDGRPSFRNEEYTFDHNLGEQIRESIVELTKRLHKTDLMTLDDSLCRQDDSSASRSRVLDMTQRINAKIKSRIEPPDVEFFIDVVPLFGEMAKAEADKKASGKANGHSSRRSRRMLSYLDTIGVYLEAQDSQTISDVLLNPLGLGE